MQDEDSPDIQTENPSLLIFRLDHASFANRIRRPSGTLVSVFVATLRSTVLRSRVDLGLSSRRNLKVLTDCTFTQLSSPLLIPGRRGVARFPGIPGSLVDENHVTVERLVL